jgi:hypothetical protein
MENKRKKSQPSCFWGADMHWRGRVSRPQGNVDTLFGHVVRLSTRHTSGDVEWAGGNEGLEVQRDAEVGVVNAGVIHTRKGHKP